MRLEENAICLLVILFIIPMLFAKTLRVRDTDV